MKVCPGGAFGRPTSSSSGPSLAKSLEKRASDGYFRPIGNYMYINKCDLSKCVCVYVCVACVCNPVALGSYVNIASFSALCPTAATTPRVALAQNNARRCRGRLPKPRRKFYNFKTKHQV